MNQQYDPYKADVIAMDLYAIALFINPKRCVIAVQHADSMIEAVEYALQDLENELLEVIRSGKLPCMIWGAPDQSQVEDWKKLPVGTNVIYEGPCPAALFQKMGGAA